MKYLYRAVDSSGNTIDFLLRSRRNMRSAKCFFKKMLRASSGCKPRVLSVDGNPAYPPAVKALKEEKFLDKDCLLSFRFGSVNTRTGEAALLASHLENISKSACVYSF